MLKKSLAFLLTLLVMAQSPAISRAFEKRTLVPDIVFTIDANVDADDAAIAEVITDWQEGFNALPITWKQYVKTVAFFNDGEGYNNATAFTNPKNANFRTIRVKLLREEDGKKVPNVQRDYTYIVAHEVSHLIDTRERRYSGENSGYKVNGKNFYQLWEEDTRGYDFTFSESFAIEVGRARRLQVMGEDINSADENYLPAHYRPYLTQFLSDIDNTFPEIYEITLTRWSTGKEVGDRTFNFDKRPPGYESFHTTFTINNTGNVPTNELTVTLSDTAVFTLGNADTSVAVKKIPSVEFGGSVDFNIRTKGGVKPGVYTATVEVSDPTKGHSRDFEIRFTVE